MKKKTRRHAVAQKGKRLYEVTLRQDVQQIALMRVEASSRQEAIAIAEGVVDIMMWRPEEHIGSHRPEAREVRRTPKRRRPHPKGRE